MRIRDEVCIIGGTMEHDRSGRESRSLERIEKGLGGGHE